MSRPEKGWQEVIAELPLLGRIEPQSRRQLLERGEMLRIGADKVVFAPGSPCQAFILVLEGAVRVEMLSDTGRGIVLYRVLPGQTCVLTTACLLSEESYPAEGRTEMETLALTLPLPHFRQLLATSAGFRDFVFAGFGQRITDILLRMEETVFHRVDARLARLLVSRSRAGVLPITHQALAGELGTAREVVSRQLKSFEREGLIELARGEIRIRAPELLERRARNVT